MSFSPSSLLPLALQPRGGGLWPDTCPVPSLLQELDSHVDWLGVGLVMSMQESTESS